MNLLIFNIEQQNAAFTEKVLMKLKPEKVYAIFLDRNNSTEKIKAEMPETFADIEFLSRSGALTGQYDDYYNSTPPDETLITKMTPYEPMIMKNLERTSENIWSRSDIIFWRTRRTRKTEDPGYDQRKRLYYRHLRYWNSFLLNKKIDCVIFLSAPHQIYDTVVYHLCQINAIARVLRYRYRRMAYYFCYDFKDPLPEYGQIYAENERKYEKVPTEEIPLSPMFESTFTLLSGTDGDKTPYYMKKNRTDTSKIADVIKKKGLKGAFCGALDELDRRRSDALGKRQYRRLAGIYDKLAKEPVYDAKTPYIYFPLHLQPEMTSNPLGDIFVEQYLAIEMLAAALPANAKIYVKENPKQFQYYLARSKEFYTDISTIPKVSFVPRNTDTYKLIENASAIACLIGTAGLEAMMTGKPFLMFGYNPDMYCKGTFHIATNKQCREAVEHIFAKGAKHTLRDIRLHYKTMSDIPYMPYNDKMKYDYTEEDFERYTGAFADAVTKCLNKR